VAHFDLLPRVAILDVRFHRAMPPHIAAQTGLDALGQALESTWAVGANEQSLRFAAAAGRRIAGSLAESVRSGDDEARVAMMIGAHLAGRAINISKTTASHALSYQLTQRFDLAHGHAVALTLGHLASANARAADDRCCDPRGVLDARRRVDDAAGYLGVPPEDLPRVVQDLLEQVALPATLEEAGVHLSSVAFHSDQPWPFPSSLMIGCLAEAETTALDVDREELEDARWFGLDELLDLKQRGEDETVQQGVGQNRDGEDDAEDNGTPSCTRATASSPPTTCRCRTR